MHPHEEWRQSLNDIPLNPYCEILKIQRNVVQALEKGRQPKFPKALHIAITMACGIEVSEKIRLASIEYDAYNSTSNTSRV